MVQNNYLNNQNIVDKKNKLISFKLYEQFYLKFAIKIIQKCKTGSFEKEADNNLCLRLFNMINKYNKNKMSIEKTLKLTDQSVSEAFSKIDRNMRTTISSYSNQYLEYPKLLTNSSSLKSLRDGSSRISQLQFQNQMLRQQIFLLRKQVRQNEQNKSHQVGELQREVNKLKKLVQKSYYSLKIFEKQNLSYREQVQKCGQNVKKHEQRNTYLQRKINEMYSYIHTSKSNHEKEMKLLWERIADLQKNLQSVVSLIEQDKKQQRYYRSQLRVSRADSLGSRYFKYN